MTAPGIEPMRSAPSANSISMPLMRGEPSRRREAMVRCLRDARSARMRAANSGWADSKSDHDANLIEP